MPRKMDENTQEAKPKYFRIDDETAAKIEQLSTEVFNSKNDCLKALIQLYELEQSKKTLPGFSADIDNFRTHLSNMEESYLHLLQLNADAELRIREEYSLELTTKTKSIAALQESLAKEKEELTSYKELYKEQRELSDERYGELNKANIALADKEKLIKMLESQTEQMNAALDAVKTDLAAKNEQLAQFDILQEKNEELQLEIKQLKEQLESERKSCADRLAKADMDASTALDKALRDAAFEKEKAIFELQSQHQNEIIMLKQQHLEEMRGLLHKNSPSAEHHVSDN